LHRTNLISSLTREGNGGGSSLAKPVSSILISDIYQAVNNTSLLGKLNRPNPQCKIGNQINRQLTALYKQADLALIGNLSTITLAEFCKKFK
jgi:DNA-binding IscR family transcriptional regulator